MSFPWAEHDETLRALVAEGLTSSQIAVALGCISRGAVIGRAYRLGLQLGANRGGDMGRPTRINGRFIVQPRPPAPKVEGPRPVVRPRPAIVCDAVPEAPRGPVSLLELCADSCRWPLGTPGSAGFGFCGRRVEPGATGPIGGATPYCEEHSEAAFQPAAERRRRVA